MAHRTDELMQGAATGHEITEPNSGGRTAELETLARDCITMRLLSCA